jgi:hypothetical protein
MDIEVKFCVAIISSQPQVSTANNTTDGAMYLAIMGSYLAQ